MVVGYRRKFPDLRYSVLNTHATSLHLSCHLNTSIVLLFKTYTHYCTDISQQLNVRYPIPFHFPVQKRRVRSVYGSSVAQLKAHHVPIFHTPAVITHGPPHPLVEHLHPTLGGTVPSHQAKKRTRVYRILLVYYSTH